MSENDRRLAFILTRSLKKTDHGHDWKKKVYNNILQEPTNYSKFW